MIQEVFHKRYKDIYFYFPNLFGGPESIPEEIEAFFNQSVHIIFYDLMPLIKESEKTFYEVYKMFTRELGVTSIAQGNNYQESCLTYLLRTYDLWKTNDSITDFIKKKITLIELILIKIDEEVRIKDIGKNTESFNQSIDELNKRFRDAKLGFYYQNEAINSYNDKLSNENIYTPYWEILKNEKYQIIDNDIRTAFERFNRNDKDAAFYAMRALESCIKIINDDLNATSGSEKGAINYIENLASKKIKFIDQWEAETLKLLFKEIRNPLGHGVGKEKPIELKYYQIKFIIDLTLVWVKSLLMRL